MSKEKTENNIGIDGDVDGSFVGTNYGDVKIVKKVILSLFPPAESNQVDWDWAKGLLASQQTDIYKRLKDTLGQEMTLMDVSIAEQQAWVNRLQADRQLQINGKDGGLLDPNKLLIETFGRDDIAGKLLILGAPGSGKTTALLSLAEQLVIGAINQPKTVIPVILELSTWREDSQSIEAWIIEQLYYLRGGDRKEKIYEQYLKRQVLLPLLDGLDELGLERQKECTKKLNEFARTYSQLVVCCRVREFEAVNIKLSNLNGAICLQELSNGQIEAYFQSIDRADLWSEMETNSALQGLLQETAEGEPGLLRVPLFIKLLADVFDPQEPIENKADLLEKYIKHKLSFEQREFDRRKELEKSDWAYETVKEEPIFNETTNSLIWIAKSLKENNKIELLIEQMQPSWIAPKLTYRLIGGLIGGLIAGLITWLIWWLVLGFNFDLIWWLIFCLFLGLIWVRGDVKAVETFSIPRSKTSRQGFFKEFRHGLMSGLMSGLWGGVIGGLMLGLKWGLMLGLIGALMWWLVLGLVWGLVEGFRQELELEKRSSPNQGIWNSLKSVLWTTVFSYPLSVILSVLFSLITSFAKGTVKYTDWLHLISSALPNSLLSGILWSLYFGILLGGARACVQHFSLRLVLWQSGTIPWNFARFLNYCVERRLLLRVGGRYRFLHRELLDHFAQLPPGTQIK